MDVGKCAAEIPRIMEESVVIEYKLQYSSLNEGLRITRPLGYYAYNAQLWNPLHHSFADAGSILIKEEDVPELLKALEDKFPGKFREYERSL
jgi:hypothetical protein